MARINGGACTRRCESGVAWGLSARCRAIDAAPSKTRCLRGSRPRLFLLCRNLDLLAILLAIAAAKSCQHRFPPLWTGATRLRLVGGIRVYPQCRRVSRGQMRRARIVVQRRRVITVFRRQRGSAGDGGGFGKVGVAHGRNGSISDPAGKVGRRGWRGSDEFALYKSSALFSSAISLCGFLSAGLESA